MKVLMIVIVCIVIVFVENRGNIVVIKYMLVVIIVVVWISVEMGVGFFIVFGNYVWSGNWFDFFIVLIKINIVVIVIM